MADPTRPRSTLWNVPNLLTYGRLVLAVVLFVFIDWHWWFGCVVVFTLAAITDWLDGYFARLLNQGSDLGRNLDPLVDKVLVCGAFIFLLPLPQCELAPWMVVVVVGRELIVTGLRGFVESTGAKFGADGLGKIKMVLQCAALLALFIELAAHGYIAEEAYREPLRVVRVVFVWGMLVATILSGLQYVWRAGVLLKGT